MNKQIVKDQTEKIMEIMKFWDEQFINKQVNYKDHRKIVKSLNFIIKRLEFENEWNENE